MVYVPRGDPELEDLHTKAANAIVRACKLMESLEQTSNPYEQIRIMRKVRAALGSGFSAADSFVRLDDSLISRGR